MRLRARNTDPETSHEEIDGPVDHTTANQIIARLVPTGITARDIADDMEVELASISSIITQLERAGKLFRNGKRVSKNGHVGLVCYPTTETSVRNS